MPATETKDFEREFEELVQQLRALRTAAPEHVRERVRSLGERVHPPTLWDRVRTASWRRTMLVLAPTCALALVSAAVIHGVLNSGADEQAVVAPATREHPLEEAKPGASGERLKDQTLVLPSGALPAPNPTRYQDYEASMTVRVQDLDTLSDRANEAMQVARSYGGYVVSLEQSTTTGRPGQADLVLRIPVTRVEDAIMRLADLGTLIERRLSIRDLERVVQQQRQRIGVPDVLGVAATSTRANAMAYDLRVRVARSTGHQKGLAGAAAVFMAS